MRSDEKIERLSHGELVKQLSESLGQEKANDAVANQMRLLGLTAATAFDKDQTLRLLDGMAVTEGLVGIVARFAKVRIILHFK